MRLFCCWCLRVESVGDGHKPPLQSTPTYILWLIIIPLTHPNQPDPTRHDTTTFSITGFAACLDALSQTGQTPLIYDLTIGYHGYSVRPDGLALLWGVGLVGSSRACAG